MSLPGLPTVSLIIVSRGRPALLARCLMAVAQMDHPAFEVIVVADPTGLAAVAGQPVKALPFDETNISVARNLGVAAAAGDVVAFIDDDAVPEPLWLWHLTQPFADPAVLSAGGFVLGWNGISLEWAGGTVSTALETGALAIPDGQASLHPNRPGQAIEVKGVNSAYRRQALLQAGGFDPLLRYYMDETELNLRLARLGGLTAVVPLARVHHTKAESRQRHANRVPKSLYDVGFSTGITLRRHAGAAELDLAHHRLCQVEKAKLARLVARRLINAADATQLIGTHDQGFSDALLADLPPCLPLTDGGQNFHPFPSATRPVVVLAGRPWAARSLRTKAAALARQGSIVCLFIFSPTALFHRRRFAGGVWIQRGGLFGKSDRSDPIFRLWCFGRRLSRESARFMSGFRKT